MENKRIYARQVPPEYQESPLQWCDEWPENVYIFGNRHYKERTEGLQEIRDALQDLDTAADKLSAGAGWYDNWQEALQDLLPPEGRETAYSRAERLELLQLARDYINTISWCDEEINIILRVLEIVRGEEYETSCIRGCCQGDWQNIIYPASYGNTFRDAFETEYFNTGTEWIIHDEDTEPEEPDDVNGYSIYCYTYDPRTEIAAEFGADPESVILYEFDGYSRRANWRAV
jgi:hypothetical protein